MKVGMWGSFSHGSLRSTWGSAYLVLLVAGKWSTKLCRKNKWNPNMQNVRVMLLEVGEPAGAWRKPGVPPSLRLWNISLEPPRSPEASVQAVSMYSPGTETNQSAPPPWCACILQSLPDTPPTTAGFSQAHPDLSVLLGHLCHHRKLLCSPSRKH